MVGFDCDDGGCVVRVVEYVFIGGITLNDSWIRLRRGGSWVKRLAHVFIGGITLNDGWIQLR
jgi:hypothetical protein